MGKIFYLMGKSASGKDHIYARLMREGMSFHKIILYTTRPIRSGEESGKQYFFVTEEDLHRYEKEGKLIEARAYDTVHGIWNYFMVDDGQVDLTLGNYIGIGTLESYIKIRDYYGADQVIPLYIEVETGERLTRALNREKQEENPKYAEMCRRFLADEEDFSEQNIENAGIKKRFQNINLDDCVMELTNYIKNIQ